MNTNIDETEDIRRGMVHALNTAAKGQPKDTERERLEREHGKGNVWDTQELGRDFEVLGFMAPFCVVRRRTDRAKGSVMFQHGPRFYFGFSEDK